MPGRTGIEAKTSKVLQLTTAQKMDALSPLCNWTHDWHSEREPLTEFQRFCRRQLKFRWMLKDREPPTEFQRFCRRQWARLYLKYRKEERLRTEEDPW